MVLNSFVIVNLHSPSERFVGRLIEIGQPGVTLRGLDLAGFEDWMNDIVKEEQAGVCPSTIFFPLHRIDKILLDEDMGGVPSLSNTFLTRIGASINEFL
jgi:hypothetical protein